MAEGRWHWCRAWDGSEPAEQPHWPGMGFPGQADGRAGSEATLCPGSLGVGTGTQDEKEESEGRQVSTDGAVAGASWRREAGAVQTLSTSRSSSY